MTGEELGAIEPADPAAPSVATSAFAGANANSFGIDSEVGTGRGRRTTRRCLALERRRRVGSPSAFREVLRTQIVFRTLTNCRDAAVPTTFVRMTLRRCPIRNVPGRVLDAILQVVRPDAYAPRSEPVMDDTVRLSSDTATETAAALATNHDREDRDE